ncbi:MAG: hypothetical protein V3V19_11195 [Cocleimonas sp.]
MGGIAIKRSKIDHLALMRLKDKERQYPEKVHTLTRNKIFEFFPIINFDIPNFIMINTKENPSKHIGITFTKTRLLGYIFFRYDNVFKSIPFGLKCFNILDLRPLL